MAGLTNCTTKEYRRSSVLLHRCRTDELSAVNTMKVVSCWSGPCIKTVAGMCRTFCRNYAVFGRQFIDYYQPVSRHKVLAPIVIGSLKC